MQKKCPRCEDNREEVEPITVRYLLEPFLNQSVKDDYRYFCCKNKDCSVVYFSENHNQVFSRKHVRKRVNFKLDKDEQPYPLCYCFGYRKEDIKKDVVENKETSVDEWIKKRIKANECNCMVNNPSGSCCLEDIREAIQEIKNNRDTGSDNKNDFCCC
ncbi:hypothetical protein C9439_00150 [archaeon SCG-AAA382B04]|nr:hypothetical protein C9439_00150 [archaeon SCG-AAA382B04]